MHAGPLGAVLLLLALGLPLVVLARRLRMSSLVAYLGTGTIAGPHVLGLVGSDELGPLAEIGASLLLFSIGLELDLQATRGRLRRLAISAAGQIGLTLAAGFGMGVLLGMPIGHAVVVACCLTMSSTLMVLRALDERRLRNREEGQTVMGLLLAQDLCLAPMLVLVSLAVPGTAHKPLWMLAPAVAAILVATFLLRRVLASALLKRVRDAQLPELEVAFAVTIALGAAFLSEAAGLGTALGAFCAGLALGGDEHRSAIETSTRPLQGLMAIIFFTAMGVLFDPSELLRQPLPIVGALAVVIVVKTLLSAAALRVAGLNLRSAIGCGLMTGQIGEFAFVIAAVFAGSADPGNQALHRFLIAVTCLSLASTPLLVRVAMRFLPRTSLEDITEVGDTIVVAGLGPVGNSVVETLLHLGHPLFLVDRNERLLTPWHGTVGVRCHKGRIEEMDDWLPVLGSRPRMVVLTFPIADTSALVASRLRAMLPDLVVVARSPLLSQVDMLVNAGAQFVICDERETARALLPILRQALGKETPADDGDANGTGAHKTHRTTRQQRRPPVEAPPPA